MPASESTAEDKPLSPIAVLWLRLPPNLRGILWLSLGAFLFAVVDVFVKSLGGRFDPLQISFFRYGCGLIFLIPVFIRFGASNMKTERLPLHIRMCLRSCTRALTRSLADALTLDLIHAPTRANRLTARGAQWPLEEELNDFDVRERPAARALDDVI